MHENRALCSKNVLCKIQPAGGAIAGQCEKCGISSVDLVAMCVCAKCHGNHKLRSLFEAFCSKQTTPVNFSCQS